MLGLEAKRAGHAAATAVNGFGLVACPPQDRQCLSDAGQGFLVAVGVQIQRSVTAGEDLWCVVLVQFPGEPLV